MSNSMDFTAAWVQLYDLGEPPEAREYAVIEAQIRRVAAMLQTGLGTSGSLFAVELQSYPSVLARLADESAP